MAGSDGRLFRAWLPGCDVEKTVEAFKEAEPLLKWRFSVAATCL